MKLRKSKVTAVFLGLTAVTLTAGEEPALVTTDAKEIIDPPVLGFDKVRRPISNPTLFDLAIPRTQIHAFFMHHRFPDSIRLEDGSKLDMGGDLNLFAIQVEYAFNERLSLVAIKDGYIDFNPDGGAFNSDEGFGNIAAGVKYAFILNPVSQYAMSGSAVIELPWGDDEVFQGEGDGSINLSLQNVKLWDQWQLATSLGLQIPFDDDFTTQSWVSAHLSYEVCKWFIPLVELNWFHVLDEGDGGSRYPDQVKGLVPAAAAFEGADLINWGAANSGDNEYVTMALGFRSRLTDTVDVGFAYEFPLTDDEDNITDDRFTVDLTWTF